jgi:hypothetical protein
MKPRNYKRTTLEKEGNKKILHKPCAKERTRTYSIKEVADRLVASLCYSSLQMSPGRSSREEC